jgi:hypothetical protein
VTTVLNQQQQRVEHPQIVPKADSERAGAGVFEFEFFHLDLRERVLLRDGNAIPLTPKDFLNYFSRPL